MEASAGDPLPPSDNPVPCRTTSSMRQGDSSLQPLVRTHSTCRDIKIPDYRDCLDVKALRPSSAKTILCTGMETCTSQPSLVQQDLGLESEGSSQFFHRKHVCICSIMLTASIAVSQPRDHRHTRLTFGVSGHGRLWLCTTGTLLAHTWIFFSRSSSVAFCWLNRPSKLSPRVA